MPIGRLVRRKRKKGKGGENVSEKGLEWERQAGSLVLQSLLSEVMVLGLDHRSRQKRTAQHSKGGSSKGWIDGWMGRGGGFRKARRQTQAQAAIAISGDGSGHQSKER